ncbi:hypothetical protein [Novosphingobium lindaniclasticum]
MVFLRKLIRPRSSTMLLEAEGQPLVQNPSEEQVRTVVLKLQRGGTSFASLTDEAGDYIQVAGSRPWCVLERRRFKPPQHERAFQETPTPKYKDGAKIMTGAGEIVLKHDEWFLLKDAAEVFVAFLHKNPTPARVKWRSMNEMLGLT